MRLVSGSEDWAQSSEEFRRRGIGAAEHETEAESIEAYARSVAD
jgi:hypothetical protein